MKNQLFDKTKDVIKPYLFCLLTTVPVLLFGFHINFHYYPDSIENMWGVFEDSVPFVLPIGYPILMSLILCAVVLAIVYARYVDNSSQMILLLIMLPSFWVLFVYLLAFALNWFLAICIFVCFAGSSFVYYWSR